jgi:hypothetical protein
MNVLSLDLKPTAAPESGFRDAWHLGIRTLYCVASGASGSSGSSYCSRVSGSGKRS